MSVRARQKAAIRGRVLLSEEAIAAGPRGHVVQLRSYAVPVLSADNYSVSITQKVQVGGSLLGALENGVASRREFTVDAPRFSIPESDVLSVFPSPGSAEANNTLPYIIFREPLLPWERCVQRNVPVIPAAQDDGVVPWIALVAFEQKELLTDGTLLPGASCDPATGVFHAGLPDLLDLSNPAVMCPLSNRSSDITEEEKRTTRVDTIMIQAQVFTSLVCDGYDLETGDIRLPVPPDTISADITRYKYLTHLREDLGDTDGLEPETHSAMFSHRTAPTGVKTQTTVFVHLVSLEGWEYVNLPLAATVQAVALTSLYSWTYSVLPSPAVSFLDKMTQLGAAPKYKTGVSIPESQVGTEWQGDFRMLRIPEETISRLDQNNVLYAKATQILKKRFTDGYSVAKFVLPTGETVPAFARGPLTPVRVPDNILLTTSQEHVQLQMNGSETSDKGEAESFTAAQSSYGKDFEIMDRDLGLVDISYSSAWQLGRLLALSHQDFSSALTNLRRNTINNAIEKATVLRKDLLTGEKPDTDAPDFMVVVLMGVALASYFLERYDSSGDLVLSNPFRSPECPLFPRAFRSDRPPGFRVTVSGIEDSVAFAQRFSAQVRTHIISHASSGLSSIYNDGKWMIEWEELKPFNELNAPDSTTYPLILKFLLDLKHLESIPTHYLLTDPAHLPPETIRFFYVDPNWVNSIVDGALSIGNTLEVQGNDIVKHNLKHAVESYSKKELSGSRAAHKPQFPKFGFFIRSEVLATWTDLRVSAPFPKEWKGDKLEILETRRIAQDTIMVMLDRCPEDRAMAADIPSNVSQEVKSRLMASVAPDSDPIYLLDSITISQPPHQQGFSLGTQLTEEELKIPDLWDVDPSNVNGDSPWKTLPVDKATFRPNDKDLQIYDWKNKVIRVKDLMGMIGKAMKIEPETDVPDHFKTAGPILFALNMGSGILHMSIDKLRQKEPPAEWPHAAQQPQPQQVAAALKEPTSTAVTEDSTRRYGASISAKKTSKQDRVVVQIDATTGTTGSKLTMLSSSGSTKQRTSVKVIAGFESIRLAQITPANKYVVAIPQPPHMPMPIPPKVRAGSLVPPALSAEPDNEPLLVISFSAMGLADVGIPIVAGPARRSGCPPTVDLLMTFTAPSALPWPEITQVNLEFPLTSSEKETQGSLLGQRLTQCYAGPGPRLLNRPRWRTQVRLAEQERMLVIIQPRGKKAIAKVQDLLGMALLLPGVRTDAQSGGEVKVAVKVTATNQDGEERSETWVTGFQVVGAT